MHGLVWQLPMFLTHDVTLNARVHILIQPDADARPVLKVPANRKVTNRQIRFVMQSKYDFLTDSPEDEVDGLHHHLLHLGLAASVRHPGGGSTLKRPG
jgi:hypothetical protein